jgi:hypothetical protein
MVISDGMTLEKVTAVGKSGFLTGTPETATAALGTAHGVGVRRASGVINLCFLFFLLY